jgi:hypothetical protein
MREFVEGCDLVAAALNHLGSSQGMRSGAPDADHPAGAAQPSRGQV